MNPTKPIRLFWGENYSVKPKEIQDAIDRALATTRDNIQLYPGSLLTETIDLIAETNKVESEQVVLGHGIEGLIHVTTTTFLNDSNQGAMFKPSFFVYRENLERYKFIEYPCTYKTKIDVDDFISKIKGSALFFLASPNTATGNYLLSKEEIEKVLQAYDGILAVDECYFGLGDQTVIDLVSKYKNLLVFRGMTKIMGLGSLRIGYAVGSKEIISKLRYNFTDIEYDPLSSYSLNVFKETFPFYNLAAQSTKNFFNKFLEFMKSKFPEVNFVKTLTTYLFMDVTKFNVPTFEIMNRLTKDNFIMSSNELTNDSSLNFPEYLELTPPPKEYWDALAESLKKAIS